MHALRTLTLVAAGLLSLAVASPAPAADSGMVQRIKVMDDSDPAGFKAAIGPGICVGDGDVTFDRFVEELPEGGHGHWKFAPEDTRIDHGGVLELVNTGGEPHTFTEVEEFGPGCVPEINELMGLDGAPVMDCDAAFADLLFPGAREDVRGLSAGKHKFECALHPWMIAVVTVRQR